MAQRITKMNVWWWLSTPYSIVFQFYLVTLGRQASGHDPDIAIGFYLSMIAAISSAIWVLVTIVHAVLSRDRNFGLAKKIMVILGVTGAIPWVFWP